MKKTLSKRDMRTNLIIQTVLKTPNKTARDYANELNISETVIRNTCINHRIEKCLAVHPKKLLQPGWYKNLSSEEQNKITKKITDADEIIYKVSRPNPKHPNVVANKKIIYSKLSKTYHVSTQKRKKLLANLNEEDYIFH